MVKKHQAATVHLYGDFVQWISWLGLVPIVGWDVVVKAAEDHPKKYIGRAIVAWMLLTSLLYFWRWRTQSLLLGYLSTFNNAALVGVSSIVQYGLAGPCTMAESCMIIMLLLHANRGVHRTHQALQMLMAFFMGCIVFYVHPHKQDFRRDVTKLIAVTVFNLLILLSEDASVLRNVSTVRLARLGIGLAQFYEICAAVFMMLKDPEQTRAANLAIAKATFILAMMLAASGWLQVEIVEKEKLSVQNQHQAQQLRMVDLALQSSETAIAITDSSQRILWLNPAMRRLGATPFVSLADGLGLNSDGADYLCRGFAYHDFQTNTKQNKEIIVRDSVFEVEVSPFPKHESLDENSREKGQDHRFVVVLKDLTELRARQKAEAIREEAEKAVEREALRTKAMMETVEVVSHELRTPLQGIMGIASLMLDEGSLSTEAREPLSLILASAGLLLTLVNNMLDVRKCDSKMMPDFQKVPVKSRKVMEDSITFCRPLAAISKVGLELKFEDSSKYAEVWADTLPLQQILINLTSNAIKYATNGSIVTISSSIKQLVEVEAMIADSLASGVSTDQMTTNTHCNTPLLVISVTDQGQGIPPGQEQKLFQKFSRLDNQEEKSREGYKTGQPSGTGIGLNLCCEFVTRLGGKIWARNNEDRGACFSFYLPLVCRDGSYIRKDRPQSPEFYSNPSSLKSRTNAVATRKHQVLLVDDTLINRKVFERMLRRIGVGLVKSVSSGSEALKELEKDLYNVVLTDLQMPNMSGTELSEKIHLYWDESKLPIVVGITASTSQDNIDRCYASGMAAVLHKPISLAEMKEFFEARVDLLTPGARSGKLLKVSS